MGNFFKEIADKSWKANKWLLGGGWLRDATGKAVEFGADFAGEPGLQVLGAVADAVPGGSIVFDPYLQKARSDLLSSRSSGAVAPPLPEAVPESSGPWIPAAIAGGVILLALLVKARK